MKIYPAIDLMGGACVRLRQGAFDARTTYALDPLVQARAFEAAGASELHVVDLDGAREGRPVQLPLIAALAAGTSLSVQTGGGLRTLAQVREVLAAGVDRVILGSLAVREPEAVAAISAEVGAGRIVVALDCVVEDGVARAATAGWQERSGPTLDGLIARYASSGVSLLCTDIGRDGMLTGPNLELYRDLCARAPDLPVLASGGVGSLEDLAALRQTPVAGVVVGKALYEGRFTLEEALAC